MEAKLVARAFVCNQELWVRVSPFRDSCAYFDLCFLTGGLALRHLRHTTIAAAISPSAAQRDEIVTAMLAGAISSPCLVDFELSTSGLAEPQLDMSLTTFTAKTLWPARKEGNSL